MLVFHSHVKPGNGYHWFASEFHWNGVVYEFGEVCLKIKLPLGSPF